VDATDDRQLLKLDSTDFDLLAATLTRWHQEYRQLSSGRFHGGLRYLDFGGVELLRVRWDQVIQYRGLPPTGSAGFAVPLKFVGETRWLGQPLAANTLIGQSNGEEAELVGAHQSDIAIFTLPHADFARRFLLRTGMPFDDAASRLNHFPNSAARVSRLRSYLAQFFRYLENATPSQLTPAIETQVLDTVLAGAIDIIAEHLPSAQHDITRARHRRTVDRAETYCLENADRPVMVTEMCAALGVSERTLRNAFYEHKGMSPTQYLKATRLNEVRRRLLRADQRTTHVQDVAAEWGFWHMGHFAADYKRLFGETASRTLATQAKWQPVQP